mmetsp:Transcript_62040/g.131029  ORF Transcript_62040/g.131029 Transcript_62040/m.131029 type:complete len:163 (+) Transcript_62040:491-979(+)
MGVRPKRVGKTCGGTQSRRYFAIVAGCLFIELRFLMSSEPVLGADEGTVGDVTVLREIAPDIPVGDVRERPPPDGDDVKELVEGVACTSTSRSFWAGGEGVTAGAGACVLAEEVAGAGAGAGTAAGCGVGVGAGAGAGAGVVRTSTCGTSLVKCFKILCLTF